MTEHEPIAEARASEFGTEPRLIEIRCNSTYYVLDADGDYCPNCGEKLNR